MNKAYKVVYNETTGTYVAVAEIESSRGKSTKSQTSVTTRESALNSFQWQPLSKISTLLIPILGGLGSLMVSNQASAIILEGDIACANGNTQTIVGPDGVTVYSSSPGNPIDGYLSPASTWSTVAGCGADGGEGTTTYASTLYGAFTKATGNFAVAMGFDARSAGSAVAIGTQARASSQGSVAIGTSAKAQNVNAVAVGTNTIAGNQNDVVIGNNITSTSTLLTSSAEATSKEFGTIAIGNEVDVGGTRMVVIGNESGMTVGSGTDSHDSIAIGTQTRLNGQRVIAIGTGVNNIGINSIAMGSYSNVDFASQGGTAVGRETKLQNSFLGTAIGNQTHVVGSDGGTAVGDRHKVTNSGYAAAFGSRAEVTDSANAIAIGAATKVTGASNGIAIGRDSATSAENGLALGTASSTSGSASIAIGSNSKNPAANSIALGHKASIVNAQNVGAIVIGDNARSEYYGAAEQFVIAIGANSNSYAYSVALGKEASADRGAYDAEGGSIAIGYRANTTDASRASIAMGVNSQVTSQYGVAIGTQSKASGANATAMGHNALASRANSIVIGTNAVSNGVADSTVVIGDGASSVGDGSQGIIIGAKSSNNDAVNSITIGHDASTYKGDAVVNIGYGANTSAGYSVTIGPNAASFGAISAQHQVTIGSGANTSAANAIAVGHSAASAGSKAAAFGYQSNASALSAMALGSQSTASGIYSVAVGDSSKAIDRYAIAMGYQSNASGPDSIAIGVGSAASGNQSIAVGYKNQVTGNNSGAFGDPNVISGNNSYALGNNNTISGNSTHVLGNNNTAKGSSSYIIGNNSSTELSNDIAIGTEAKTGISTQPTEGFSGAQVAIGYKATTGTDGQIALGTMTNAGAVNHTIAIGTKATTTGNSSIAVGRNAASSGLNAAAVGVGATAVGSSSAAYGTNSNSEGGNSVAIGSAAHSASTNSIALGNTSEVTANNAIAIGSGAVASVANSVALGNGATTSAAVGTASTTLGNTTFNVAGTTPTGTVSVGKAGSERTVTNVAAGRVTATSTDAINGSQLYVVAAFADQGLNFTANSGGTVNRDLGQTLNIVGSLNNKALTIEPTSVAATAGQYSARNTQTVSDPTTGRIQIQFADRPTLSGVVLDGKDGQDAGIQFGKDGLSLKGVGVDGKDGITIVGANGKDGITFNKDGTITNVVQSTTPDGLATNKSVDDKVAANKALGLNFTGNTGPTLHRDLGQTLSIIGSAQTLNKSSDATKETTAGSYYARNLQTVTVVNSLTGDTTLQMLLADRPTFSGVVLDGKDGKDASIQFGKDGLSLKGVGVDGKDGITIVGANGKDGITFNKDGTITNVVQSTGPDGLVTNKQLDDTKALGLNFTGNAGGTVHRNLGETLNIIGSAQGLNKTFDTATTGSTTGAYYSRNLQTVTDPITGRVQVQFADRPTLSGVVLDGKDGKDASIQFGKDGLSLKGVGVDGKDGITIVGANGKDGITFNQDGTITNVVQSTDPDGLVTNKQLDDTKALGLNFTGNAGGTVHRNLGETLNIIGSAQSLNKTFDTATAGSTTGEYYSRNLQTVTDPNTGRVQVQFADRPTLSGVVLDGKDGKDASVQFGKDGLSITGLGVNGKDGIGIQGMTGANGKDGISFNPDGTISNVTDGKNPGDVATKDQIDKLASGGLDFLGNAGGLVHRNLGQTLSIIGSAQNLNKAFDNAAAGSTTGEYYSRNLQTVTDPNTGRVQVQFADRPTLSGVVLDGKDGKDASVQFGKDGLSITGLGVNGKDGIGIQGMTGANGKDGISFNPDGTISNVTDGKNPGDVATKDQIDKLASGGLDFLGNAGGLVHRNLGQTLSIIGSAQNLNKAFDNAAAGSTTGEYYSRNLQTVTDPNTGRVQVQFADRPTLSGVVLDGKDGKDASVQFGKDGLSITGLGVNGKDGIGIQGMTGANGKDGISFNPDGTISNVTDGKNPGDVATKDQIDKLASGGLDFLGNAGGLVHRNLGQTLSIIGSAQNLNKAFDNAAAGSTTGEYYSRNLQTVTDPNTGRVQVQFADRPTLSGVVLDGKDGKDASVQFGKDGLSITGLGVNGKDGIGIQGMTGANGKDGISFNPDGTISNVTDGKNPGDVATKDQIDKLASGGLDFLGNAGGLVHRNLGQTLSIIGSAQNLNKAFDNAAAGSTTGEYYSRNLQTVTDPNTGRVQVQFADRPTLSGVVLDGKDGKDASVQFGKDGLSITGLGVNGKDGIGIQGMTGANGKDGISFNPDGTISNVTDGKNPGDVATKDQIDKLASGGLDFLGNAGGLVHRNLGQTLSIIGSAQNLNKAFDNAAAGSTTGEYYSRNLQTVTDPNTGRVQVQFADRPTLSGVVLDGKDGKDASVQFGKDGLSITGLGVNGKDGIGIQGMTGANGKDGISFNPDGTISNVTDGKNPGDVATKDQIDKLASGGLDFLGNAGGLVHRNLGQTLSIIGSAQNLNKAFDNAAAGSTTGEYYSRNLQTVTDPNTGRVQVQFADRPTLSGVVLDGKDGKDASVQFGKDGLSITGLGVNGKDGIGIQGMTGANGKDGISFNPDGTISNVTDGKNPGDVVNKGQLDDIASAGLDFTANSGALVHRDLGQTLGVIGSETGLNLAVDTSKNATASKYNSSNIQTVTTGNGIQVQFADRPEFSGLVVNGKDGKDASIQFTDSSGNKGTSLVGKPGADGAPGLTVVGKDGKDGVSFNNDGTISNVTDGTRPNDAVNKGQLDDIADGLTNSGLSFTDDAGTVIHRKLGETLGLTTTSVNMKTVVGKDGIAINFSDRPEFSGLVVNGKDGKDASIQFTDPSGNKGASLVGKPGADGLPGLTVVGKDGKDGVSFNNDGTISNVTDGTRPNDAVNKGQLDDIASAGLDFTANSGALVHRDLGQTLGVIGSDKSLGLTHDTTGVATTGNYTAKNVQTVTTSNGLQVQFADRPEFSGLVVNGKDGKDASIQFTDPSGNKGASLVGKQGADGVPGLTVVGKDGKDGVSFNNDGTISNVTDGTRPKDAVNKGQLDDIASAGLDFTANSGALVHRDLGQTLGVIGSETGLSLAVDTSKNATAGKYNSSNIQTVTTGNGIQMQFADRPEFSGLVVNGKDGKDASIQFTDPSGNKGASLVGKQGADGVPGLTVVGKDGKDGVSFNNDGTISNVTDGTRPKDAVNKGQLDGVSDALTNSGLNFTDDAGTVIHRKLGETLGLTTTSVNMETVVGKDGIAINFSDRPEFSGLVVNGKDGKDASIQFTDPSGNKGASLVGKPGADGVPGLTVVGKDGKDGVSFNNDGTISNVTDGTRPKDAVNKGQLDDIASAGLDFTANSGALVHRDLGQTLGVIGSETGLSLAVDTSKNATAGKYNSSNIQTVTTGNGIQMQFADRPEFSGLVVNGKDGKDASIQFTDPSGNKGASLVGKQGADGVPGLTVVGKDGKDGVSFNNDGTISNVTDGTRPKDAVNKGQLDGVSDALTNSGLNFTDDAGTVIHRKLGETLGLTTTSVNMETVVGKDGIAINFSDRPEFSGLVVNGKDGKDASIQFTDPSGNKGASLVGKPGADGVPGLTVVGKDGKDGVSFNNDGTISNVTDGTRPKDAVNKGQLDDIASAGLDFTANSGALVHRDLGQTLGVIGSETGLSLAVDTSKNATAGKYNSSNIQTVTTGNGIQMQFADRPEFSGLVVNGKDGKDASIQFTDPSGNKGASLVGKQGADGVPGLTVVGKDGKDGVSFNNDGTISNVTDGTRPKDAVNKGQLDGVSDALTNSGLNFTDDAGTVIHRKLGETLGLTTTSVNMETVVGKDGIAINFSDRPEFSGLVVNGKDGKDASIQFTDPSGNKGASLVGKPGADGLPGLTVVGKDGKDGVSFNNDGTISNLADGTRPKDAVNKGQLDGIASDGLNFTANSGALVHRDLGQTLGVIGSETGLNLAVDTSKDATAGKYSASNIQTVTTGEGIQLQFADRPEFSGLVVNGQDGQPAQIQFTDSSGNPGTALVGKPGADGLPGLTVVGKDGKDGVSFNNDGTISNLADGTRPKDAVNLSQLTGVSDALTNAGLNFTDDAGTVIHRKLGETLGLTTTSVNMETVVGKDGIAINFSDRPEFSGLVVNGKDGKDASIQFTDPSGNKGASLVGKQGADGVPGLTVVGKDGKDGVSFNNDGTISNVTDGTRPKDAVNKGQLDGVSDALTNSGLNFTDDAGTVIHRKLGETLGLTTTSVNMETVVGKDGIAINFSDRPEFSGLVVNGKDGKDASIQFTDPSGNKGASLVGKPGADGLPGLTVVGKDGKDGVSFNNDGTISNLADGFRPNDAVNKGQLDGIASDGLNFTANSGALVHRDLGQTLGVIGSETGLNLAVDTSKDATAGKYSASNIQTVTTGEGIQLQFADRPEFSGLVVNGQDGKDASIQFTDPSGNKGASLVGKPGADGLPGLTVVGKDGKDGVSFNNDGTISNLADGFRPNDAVNKGQLDGIASDGLNFTANSGALVHRDLGQTLGVIGSETGLNLAVDTSKDATAGKYSASNIQTVTTGEGIQLQFADRPEFSGLVVNGQDGQPAQIQFTDSSGNPGTALVGKPGADGLPGLTVVGKDGKDGVSFNNDGTISNLADGTRPKDAVNLSQLTGVSDALTNAGLNFTDDAGTVIHRKLGETLGLTTTSPNMETVVGKDGIAINFSDRPEFSGLVVNGKDGKDASIQFTDPSGNKGASLVGKQGADGVPGLTVVGKDGKDGVSFNNDGTISNVTDGTRPKDAVNKGQLDGVSDALTNSGLNFTDDAGTVIHRKLGETLGLTTTSVNMETVVGKDGIAINFSDRPEFSGLVVNGKDGKDASIQFTDPSGNKGASLVGKPGADGLPGLTVVGKDGKDGVSFNNDGTISNLADGTRPKDAVNKGQLDGIASDGLNFTANSGALVHRDLGQTLGVIGSETGLNLAVDTSKDATAGKYSASNIQTVTTGEGIQLQFADRPEFSGLVVNGQDGQPAQIQFTDSSGNPGTALVGKPGADGLPGLTVVGKDGKDGVSFNNDGTISNLADGTRPKDAVNLSQLTGVSDALTNAGLNFTDDAGTVIHRKLGETLGLTTTSSNMETVVGKDGIVINFSDRPEFSGLVVNGKDGKDASIQFTDPSGNKGAALVGKPGADGLPGLTVVGKDGKDGVSFNNDGTISNLADGTRPNDAVNKSQLDGVSANLTSDGLNFTASDGNVIHRDLGDTLSIIGALTGLGISEDKSLYATAGDYSAKNIQTVVTKNGLQIQLADRPEFSGLVLNGKDGQDASIQFADSKGHPGFSIVGTAGSGGVNPSLTFVNSFGEEGVKLVADGRITNVAEGKDGKDAVNVDQLTTVSNVANRGWDVSTNGGPVHNVAPGSQVDFSNNDGNVVIANQAGNITVGLAKNVTVDSIDLGGTVLNQGGLTIKDGPSITQGGIDMAGKNISNVADAVTDDQAVNLGQLNSLVTSTNNQQNVVINQIKTDIGDMDKLGATFDVSGQNMTEHKDLVSTINAMNTGGIKYMHTNGVPEVDEQGKIGPTNDSSAGGKNSSAIGVNAIIQAGGTSSVAMGHNSFVGNDATDAVAIGSGAQATGSSAIAIGHNSIASGKQALSVGTGNVVSGNNSGAFGDPNIVSGNNSYALGNNNTIAADNSFTVGNDIVIDRNVDDMTQANGASFKGSMGLGNGSTVAAAVGTKSVTIQNHTYDFAGSAPVGTVSVGSAGSERTVTNVAAGRISETSTDAINGSQLYATNEAVNNLNKGAAGIVQYSDGNNPTVSNGGVVSNNATLTGKPATVDRNGDGKVDAADGTDPVQLSNVAAGAAPTDAANVGQLQQMGSTLNNRINQVENNANAGTATAMAVAGLPQAYLPGKSMVAVAGSVYRGETGYAVGYSSISDGGNWVVKASASGNSRGHIGGTLGAGYQW